MRNKAFRQASSALAHPLSLAAIVLLLVNDHVLKHIWPSWWTGKISDAAWLVFAPLALAALLAWLIPGHWKRQTQIVGWSSFLASGLVFSLAKTLPAAHALAVQVLSLGAGGPAGLVRDPTDLLALPGLGAGFYLWRRAGQESGPARPRAWVALTLGVVATVATSPVPPDYGVVCLQQEDSRLVAIAGAGYTAVSRAYASQDGGLSWTPVQQVGKVECQMHSNAWLLTDPADARVVYRLTPGKSIERSEDGGQSFRLERSTAPEEARGYYIQRWRMGGSGVIEFRPGPLDAAIDRSTANLVVAMGQEGVLVRTPGGEWRWTQVGPYRREALNSVRAVLGLIGYEGLLALVLIPLSLASWALYARRAGPMLDVWLAIGWIAWILAAFASPAVAAPFRAMIDIITPIIAAAILLAGAIGIVRGYKELRETSAVIPGFLRRTVPAALVTAVLFFLPYLLWSQGAIGAYTLALTFALALAAVCLIACYVSLIPVRAAQPARPGPAVAQAGEHAGRTLWLQWVLASALAGAISRGLAMAIPAQPGAIGLILGGLALAVPAAVLQWLVLRHRIKGAGWWAGATALGAFVLADAQKGAATWGGLSAVLLAGLFAGLIGLMQWLILRRQAGRAGWWIVATTAAGALAQAIYAGGIRNSIFVQILSLPIQILLRLDAQPAAMVAAGFLGQAAGGAIAGAVLVWLLKPGMGRAPAGESSPDDLAARSGGI